MGFGHRNPDRILGGRDFSLINPGRRGLGVLTLRVCVWWWWWGGGGCGLQKPCHPMIFCSEYPVRLFTNTEHFRFSNPECSICFENTVYNAYCSCTNFKILRNYEKTFCHALYGGRRLNFTTRIPTEDLNSWQLFTRWPFYFRDSLNLSCTSKAARRL